MSRHASILVLTPVLLALAGPARAQVPPGYYDSVARCDPAAMRATLHDVIDDHLRFPYTSSSTDTWDILELGFQDPANAGRILDVYKNESYPKQGGGNSLYNREHPWPKSYGFPDDGPDNYPYTDCHVLFLCNDTYNSARSNKPYRNCSSSCNEYTTDSNNGQGGGSGNHPGNSNWTSGSFTNGSWETWIGRRGDVARALFYLDVRYEGGTHGQSGFSEPDLILTNSLSQISSSNTGNNESVAYMGLLSVLLQWHLEDPVDAFERRRNDVTFSFQGNRNPFVDHPEWVACIFQGNCLPPVVSYCTAGTTSNGCRATVTTSGVASLSQSTGFDVTVAGVEGNKQGIIYFGTTGRVALPWGNGTSFRCVKAPGSRTGNRFAGGTAGMCDGVLSLDFNAWMAANPTRAPLAGSTVNLQGWFRDPPSAKTTSLSNAIEFVVCP